MLGNINDTMYFEIGERNELPSRMRYALNWNISYDDAWNIEASISRSLRENLQ